MNTAYAIKPVYTLEFQLPGLPKLANQLLRSHWGTKVGHANTWKRKVWRAAWVYKPVTPLTRAKLTLTRVSSREPDYDGLVSSFKSVIDGLVEAGILANDKRENVGVPEYLWRKGPRSPGKVIVRVEEISQLTEKQESISCKGGIA